MSKFPAPTGWMRDMPAMTRATCGDVRVTVESYVHTCGVRWQWRTEDGRLVNGFVTSADAYTDACDVFGPADRICCHSEPETPA